MRRPRELKSPFTRRSFLATAGITTLAGCTGDDRSDAGTTPTTTDTTRNETEASYEHPLPAEDPDWRPARGSPLSATIEVKTLVENLEIPWDVAFTGEGEMFVTERTGSVLGVEAETGRNVVEPENAIDAGSVAPGSDERSWLVDGGEGGTLGIAVHPEYPGEPYVYVYYTANQFRGSVNRVVRYDVTADEPATTEEVIVGSIPAGTYHNGGRIDFGPDGNLWVCTGDSLEGSLARDPSSLAGKVLRVEPDGSAPPSNPDLDGDDRVFSLGHRNPQGIDWLPSGVPIVTEHGPSSRDEVSILHPGGDYGWNDVRDAPNTEDEEFETYADRDDIQPPLVHVPPGTPWAPSGATFYTGGEIAPWQNRYVVGGLISQTISVVTLTPPDDEPPPLDGDSRRYDGDWMDQSFTATVHRLLHDELGRVRHVVQDSDGNLYAITSNRDGRARGEFPRHTDDRLVELVPE